MTTKRQPRCECCGVDLAVVRTQGHDPACEAVAHHNVMVARERACAEFIAAQTRDQRAALRTAEAAALAAFRAANPWPPGPKRFSGP